MVTTAPIEAVPGLPDDDIADPVVPPGALAPLPVDQFAELKAALASLARVVDTIGERLPTQLDAQSQTVATLLAQHRETLSATEAGALQHLCEALDGLKAGLVVSGAPYACTMQALTPQGFPVSVTIQHHHDAAFFEAVTKVAPWFASQSYTPPPAAVAF